MKRKALILCGGWEGHEPQVVAGRFKEFLESEDFEVSVADNVAVLEDKDRLMKLDLFIPMWTNYGDVPQFFFEPLLEAAGSGMGVAGCHGGMCDAFRNNAAWQFLTGANWVCHPGCDGVPFRINIKSKSNPITEGIADFDVVSEQYYLHVDPANEVLATTRFPVVKWYHSANGEVDVPQIWTKKWGHGRVFYNALGHRNDIFDIPPVWEIMKRGMLWAADGKRIAVENGLSADEFKSDKGMYYAIMSQSTQRYIHEKGTYMKRYVHGEVYIHDVRILKKDTCLLLLFSLKPLIFYIKILGGFYDFYGVPRKVSYRKSSYRLLRGCKVRGSIDLPALRCNDGCISA